MKYIFIAGLCATLFGCQPRSASTYETPARDTVVVQVDRPVQKNVRDYFSQLEIIPLETNRESAIAHIDRLVIDNDLLYILDRTRGAILIFNREGDFLQKIERKGRGPQEYIKLVDFSLNRRTGEISVLTDRPTQLKKYDPNGQFISSEDLSVYFDGIANDNGQDILFNTLKQNRDNYYLWFKNDTSYTQKIPVGKTNSIYPMAPSMVESQGIYFTERYGNVILRTRAEEVVPMYYLDFGTHWLSDRLFEENVENAEFFSSESQKNKMCHSVFMIRDTENHLVFRTNLPGFVIYDKQNRTADYLKALKDDEIGYMCLNYIAHDADDQKMLFTLTPANLQNLSKFNLADNNSVNGQRILEIASTIEEDANPVLLLYTFK